MILFASKNFSIVGRGSPKMTATVVPGGIVDHLKGESFGIASGIHGVKRIDITG